MDRLRIGLVVALLAVPGLLTAKDPAPTDDDWWWLNNDAWRAIDSLMPLADHGGMSVTFRSFRDLYHDVPERYFQITDLPGRTLTAILVVPVGKSLQQQLLELHLKNRTATPEVLMSQLTCSRSELSAASCPGLREQMEALAKVRIDVPSLGRIALHPTNYRVILRTGMGDVDANLVEEQNPLVQWAAKTYQVLAQCADPTRNPPKS